MKSIFRTTFVIVGILSFILTIGLTVQLPLLASILPSTGLFPLDIFLASITASIAASLLWIGFSGELGAAAGGAIDLLVFYVGLLIFQLHSQKYGSQHLLTGVLLCLLGAIVSLAIFLWFRRYPIEDRRLMFLYGLSIPRWHNACGQLWSFLAYDIVLIFPFLLHFTTVSSARLPSLIVNTIILVYSGVVALYYLLIKKETRSRQKIKSLLSQAKSLEWSR